LIYNGLFIFSCQARIWLMNIPEAGGIDGTTTFPPRGGGTDRPPLRYDVVRPAGQWACRADRSVTTRYLPASNPQARPKRRQGQALHPFRSNWGPFDVGVSRPVIFGGEAMCADIIVSARRVSGTPPRPSASIWQNRSTSRHRP
jgi:hypothetical protein